MSATPLPYGRAASLGSDAVLSALRTSPRGLSGQEAVARRARSGPNELPQPRRAWPRVLARQFASPFAWLLLGAAVISAFTGDWHEAGLIFLFTLINTFLGFFQEERAERATKALRTYWRANARVVRSGVEQDVPAADLVTGDVVRLRAGDRVPADVRFLRAHGVLVDESILTGETEPSAKSAKRMVHDPAAFHEAANVGFAGTMLVGGDAEAVVIATGRHSAAGATIALAEELKPASAFEKEIGQFATFTLKLIGVTLVMAFALNLGLKGMGRFDELLVFVIALTVGVIPEALPVVTTMALSSGAMRLAKKGVVVKRLTAINDLGGIEVLCTDKTGTITRNEMTVVGLRVPHGKGNGKAKAHQEAELLRAAVLGGERVGNKDGRGNPFDTALWAKATAEMQREAGDVRLLGEAPFDPNRRRNAVVLLTPGGERLLVSRGAPETVAPLCDDAPDAETLAAALKEEGRAGNRVLAVAVRTGVRGGSPAREEHGLRWLGLVAFRDPLKPDAASAVSKAKRLGVRIKILTGDAADVAGAVAHTLKLVDDPGEVLTGAEFAAMSPAQQRRAVEHHRVFARLDPAQKFAILDLLKEKHAVGFLGDGFNDTPGLKVAHAALAVQGASDAAKDVADVILLNKSLSVICDGIEEGRRIAANVISYLKITLASNFGNFYSVAIASLFVDFLPMLPAQILLVNLLTDMPMVAIAADRPDTEGLRRPHRADAKEVIIAATVFGTVSSVFDFAAFAWFRQLGEQGLQTMWFTFSVITELALIYSLRTRKPFWRGMRSAPVLVALTGLAAVVALVLPQVAVGRAAFGFLQPTALLIGQVFALAGAYFLVTEFVKRRFNGRNNGGNHGRHAV